VFARLPVPAPVMMVGCLLISRSLAMSADQPSCVLDSAAAALLLATWGLPEDSSRVVGL
jgi:hypothetical protein